MTAYAFRPMSAVDLPTIQRWLGTPHVSQWWHDPSEQFELVRGDLGDPDMAQFIVTADARAIRAYEKAGFCRDRIVDTPDGTALLMIRDRQRQAGLPII